MVGAGGDPGGSRRTRLGALVVVGLFLLLALSASAAPYGGRPANPDPAAAEGAGPTPSMVAGNLTHPALSITNVTVGAAPRYTLFDPADDEVYVANTLSDNVSVLSGDHVVGTVPLGAAPAGMAYNARDGTVYVQEPDNGSVAILRGTTLLRTVIDGFGSSPPFVTPAYDPANGLVYVVGPADGKVAVLNGTTLQATVAVGSLPIGAVYDPINGHVYVENFASTNVSVLDNTSVRATISLLAPPLYSTVDPTTGLLYVPVSGGSPSAQSFLYVINGTTIAGHVWVGDGPYSAAYDPADHTVDVMNMGSGNVSVLRGSTLVGTVTVGTQPFNATFDPTDGNMYVSDAGSKSVTVVNGTLAVANVSVGGTPFFAAYDARYGTVDVPVNETGTVALLTTVAPPPEYSVNFTEQGLPAGTVWSVQFDGALQRGAGTTFHYLRPNGTGYAFTVPPVAGFAATPTNGTVNVTGRPVTVPIAFRSVGPTTAPLRFAETGLPPGSNWSVLLVGTGAFGGSVSNSSTAATVDFVVPVGFTGQFSIRTAAAYAATPSTGDVTMPTNGSGVTVPVQFRARAPPASFVVTFTEQGLPVGTSWSVLFNGTPGSAVVEAGLVGASINFSAPNGSYPFRLGGVPGWSTAAYGGQLTVAGSDLGRTVDWQPFTYAVRFLESGLPSGTNWSVDLQGVLHSSEGAAITFLEPNGSYAFVIGVPSGWVGEPTGGGTNVSGTPVSVTVSFSTAPGFLGLAGNLGYYLVAAALAAAVAAAVVALAVRRRRAREDPRVGEGG